MDQRIWCYEQAAALLPQRLRREAQQLSGEQKAMAEELRLRTGRALSVLLPEGELKLKITVLPEDLEALCNLATEFSRYAAMESIRDGYLSVRGGCRLGLCGTAVMKDGVNTNLRELSSAAIRIARERKGIAEELAPQLFSDGRFTSTLILSPPGGGKTTLLRDLVRCLSDGADCPKQRVALADERGEVAVMWRGAPQMEIGGQTDVIESCPKAVAIPMLLRCMNPQIVAVDEITQPADLRAMTQAANCGVGLLATIHAADTEELRRKPLYASLLEAKVFSRAIRILRNGEERAYQVEELPC